MPAADGAVFVEDVWALPSSEPLLVAQLLYFPSVFCAMLDLDVVVAAAEFCCSSTWYLENQNHTRTKHVIPDSRRVFAYHMIQHQQVLE